MPKMDEGEGSSYSSKRDGLRCDDEKADGNLVGLFDDDAGGVFSLPVIPVVVLPPSSSSSSLFQITFLVY